MRAIALLNSKIGSEYLKIFSPTVDFKVGDVIQIPDFAQKDEIISKLTKRCIKLSKEEWDSYETSWNFVRHPLIGHFSTIADSFQEWTNKCNVWFESMKETEEELNRIFIDIYGLQDEMTPDVDDKDITKMVDFAEKTLIDKGYKPYYLYRQKNQLCGLENVGYFRDDSVCIFNVDSMEETNTVIGLGAGAMSKRVFNLEHRIERQPNVKFIEDYIARIDEMIEKKKEFYK